jgi:hypothetical protein
MSKLRRLRAAGRNVARYRPRRTGWLNLLLALVLLASLFVTACALRALPSSTSSPAEPRFVQWSDSPSPVPSIPSAGQRIVLWGDSLAWEARDAFTQTARKSGAEVLVRTWGGTAICDWLNDIRTQISTWKPTVAVLSFSGNTFTQCMQRRDVLTAYRKDMTAAVSILVTAGVRAYLVESPPRRDQAVDADGHTDLGRAWRTVAAAWPATRTVPAGRAVTDHSRWTATLPCQPDEPCDRGTVTVRSPDGVHFCPIVPRPMEPCPVYSAGAQRYGTAMAAAATEAANADGSDVVGNSDVAGASTADGRIRL